MIEPRDVGSRIRAIRLRLNLSQEQFGQRLGVRKLAVVKYEGGRVPKLAMLNKIARLGEVPTSWFFTSESAVPKRREIAVPDSLEDVVLKLLDELQISDTTPLTVRRRFEARGKELLIRCRRDLAEYRGMLGIRQSRRQAGQTPPRHSK